MQLGNCAMLFLLVTFKFFWAVFNCVLFQHDVPMAIPAVRLERDQLFKLCPICLIQELDVEYVF